MGTSGRTLRGYPMVVKSRLPVPAVSGQSLGALLRETLATFAERTALIDGPSGRSYTYQQLLDLSASIANALVARGIQKGDRVAFVCPNVPEVALAYHGVILAGAVAMMLNPLSTKEELKKYLAVGRPKLVITVDLFLDAIRGADAGMETIVLGGDSFTELLGRGSTPPVVECGPDDLAVMPYSSGTTGFPKGVMLTHRNVIAQTRGLMAMDDAVVIPGSHLLAVLPFFHIYGIMAFLTYGLMQGATIVSIPRFDFVQYLELARKYEVPLLHVVPPILLGLAKYPAELNLPHLKAALVGAAPLSAELALEFSAKSGAEVFQVYGMTEVAGGSHLGTLAAGRNKPGSIGELIAGLEARVVSIETGKDVDPSTPGEIWVRGAVVMKGYFENPEATDETIDADGWLHTGDIGYSDADGDWYLVDRLKELIKYKGLQVAPAELEAVLLQHEAVADAAVYPYPDDEAGEIPKAAVVLKPGSRVGIEALMEFVASRVAPQKRVRAMKLVEAIPKSASGKILRRVLIAEDR